MIKKPKTHLFTLANPTSKRAVMSVRAQKFRGLAPKPYAYDLYQISIQTHQRRTTHSILTKRVITICMLCPSYFPNLHSHLSVLSNHITRHNNVMMLYESIHCLSGRLCLSLAPTDTENIYSITAMLIFSRCSTLNTHKSHPIFFTSFHSTNHHLLKWCKYPWPSIWSLSRSIIPQKELPHRGGYRVRGSKMLS